jgi:hypothetical protein
MFRHSARQALQLERELAARTREIGNTILKLEALSFLKGLNLLVIGSTSARREGFSPRVSTDQTVSLLIEAVWVTVRTNS